VKNWFQSLPFKCNLQRYNVEQALSNLEDPAAVQQLRFPLSVSEVGFCTLESS
jgi:hypothetical protein